MSVLRMPFDELSEAMEAELPVIPVINESANCPIVFWKKLVGQVLPETAAYF